MRGSPLAEVNPLIIHILFILKSDENEQERANSLIALLNLISHHKNEDFLIEVSKMMDTETTLMNNSNLKNISIIEEENSELANIFYKKGRIDNHYLIRKQVVSLYQQIILLGMIIPQLRPGRRARPGFVFFLYRIG